MEENQEPLQQVQSLVPLPQSRHQPGHMSQWRMATRSSNLSHTWSFIIVIILWSGMCLFTVTVFISRRSPSQLRSSRNQCVFLSITGWLNSRTLECVSLNALSLSPESFLKIISNVVIISIATWVQLCGNTSIHWKLLFFFLLLFFVFFSFYFLHSQNY